MGVGDFVGALVFGILATGVTIFPEMVAPLILGSFVMAFFVKWIFDKVWDALVSLKLLGFYFICFFSGILVVIGAYVLNLEMVNLWLTVHGLCWIAMALLLIKAFADEVFYASKELV